jgi:hypothetical protein
MNRALLYIVVWVFFTWRYYAAQVALSQIKYDAGDLSAFAWYGFLPFILPIFMAHAGMITLAIAFFAESSLLIWKWYSGKG